MSEPVPICCECGNDEGPYPLCLDCLTMLVPDLDRAALEEESDEGEGVNPALSCVFCAKFHRRDDSMNRTHTSLGEVGWFEPMDPVTPGHLLFVPVRHGVDAASDPYGAAAATLAAAQYVDRQRLDANIITSIGMAATQTVRHLHVHVVPRTHGDGLTLPWTDQKEKA